MSIKEKIENKDWINSLINKINFLYLYSIKNIINQKTKINTLWLDKKNQ